MTYKTIQVSGERLPGQLKPGTHWLAEYTLDGADFPQNVSYKAHRVVITADNQASIFETLTAPAGKLKVLRVKVSEKIQYLDENGLELASPLQQEYYEYWGEGYGLVRIHADRVNKWDYVMVKSDTRS
jgi:hypothetical protein